MIQGSRPLGFNHSSSFNSIIMRTSFIVGLAAFAAQALALPTDHIIHERVPVDVKDWVKGDAAKPEEVLSMRFGLKQSNLDRAHEFLNDVSDPKSANYGQYWDAEKIAETFAPR
jgi:tripeptidyl-peptidase I